MNRLTWTNPNGQWGLNGITEEELKNTGSRIYAALCKLRDYENTTLSPEDVVLAIELQSEAVIKLDDVTKKYRELQAVCNEQKISVDNIIREMTKYICDELCVYPQKGWKQEQLDIHCQENCRMAQYINRILRNVGGIYDAE